MTRKPRKQMRRIEHSHDVRFVTFSTYLRRPLLSHPKIMDRFMDELAQSKQLHRFHLYAWVVMPEHVHLLLWPLIPQSPLSIVLRDLKREVAEAVIARWRELDAPILKRLVASDGSTRFWQRGGGHDRNTRSEQELVEKMRYSHQNPVKRGLVTRSTDWRWSSARWYSGDRESPVALDPLPPKRPIQDDGV